MSTRITRRTALQGIAATSAISAFERSSLAVLPRSEAPLEEFRYDQVSILGARQLEQRANVLGVLTGLDEDSLLYPFRAMSGKPAPGVSLQGWYEWLPNYDFHHDAAGLCPGATFGQWMSALSRFYAQSKFGDASGDAQLGERDTH